MNPLTMQQSVQIGLRVASTKGISDTLRRAWAATETDTTPVACNRCGSTAGGTLTQVETTPGDGTQTAVHYEADGRRVDFCPACDTPLGYDTTDLTA